MEPLDWMSAAFNVAIGLFLGLALSGLLALVADGFWVVALAMAVIGAGAALAVLAFDHLLTRATDRFFPSGIQPAANPKPRGRKPMARLLSLPAGLVLGMGLAQLGLTRAILDLF
jgi:hypothetical protein